MDTTEQHEHSDDLRHHEQAVPALVTWDAIRITIITYMVTGDGQRRAPLNSDRHRERRGFLDQSGDREVKQLDLLRHRAARDAGVDTAARTRKTTSTAWVQSFCRGKDRDIHVQLRTAPDRSVFAVARKPSSS